MADRACWRDAVLVADPHSQRSWRPRHRPHRPDRGVAREGDCLIQQFHVVALRQYEARTRCVRLCGVPVAARSLRCTVDPGAKEYFAGPSSQWQASPTANILRS